MPSTFWESNTERGVEDGEPKRRELVSSLSSLSTNSSSASSSVKRPRLSSDQREKEHLSHRGGWGNPEAVGRSVSVRSAGDTSCSEAPEGTKGSRNATFPAKIMELLDRQVEEDAIWWLTGGDGFALNPKKLPKVLKDYFYGAKPHSFSRKLNRWGFKRVPVPLVPAGMIAYHNDKFRRGEPELLKDMRGSQKKTTDLEDALYSQMVESELRAVRMEGAYIPQGSSVERPQKTSNHPLPSLLSLSSQVKIDGPLLNQATPAPDLTSSSSGLGMQDSAQFSILNLQAAIAAQLLQQQASQLHLHQPTSDQVHLEHASRLLLQQALVASELQRLVASELQRQLLGGAAETLSQILSLNQDSSSLDAASTLLMVSQLGAQPQQMPSNELAVPQSSAALSPTSTQHTK